MDSTPTAQEPVKSGSTAKLSGQMSTTQLVLSVLAFSSPLTSLAGYFSLAIMTTGQTAPVAFVIVTVALLVFSVGYVAMTKRMPRPGAFYAYISEGLGKRLGLGAAFLATLSYTAIAINVYCFAGIVISDLLTSWGGPEIPVWATVLVMVVAIGALGYFNVEVSAKVLMWVMIVEIVVMVIFNAAVLGRGGDTGLTLEPFNVATFLSEGQIWAGLLFAVLVFIGFEATALYRDEVRDPDRTIPRATYTSVIFIGVLYTLSVWVLVIAFGDNAQQVATDNNAGMFNDAASRYVGPWFSNIATALVITAVLAAILSIHNASTRYLFNLAADTALPRSLAHVHETHRSPHRASIAISVLSLLGASPFIFTGSPDYGQLAAVGSIGILILMGLVCIAIVAFFHRSGRTQHGSLWVTTIAPALSAAVVFALAVFALSDLGSSPTIVISTAVLAASFVAGLIIATRMRSGRPEEFERLGGAER